MPIWNFIISTLYTFINFLLFIWGFDKKTSEKIHIIENKIVMSRDIFILFN